MGNDKINQYRGNGQSNPGQFGFQPHTNPGQLGLSAAEVRPDQTYSAMDNEDLQAALGRGFQSIQIDTAGLFEAATERGVYITCNDPQATLVLRGEGKGIAYAGQIEAYGQTEVRGHGRSHVAVHDGASANLYDHSVCTADGETSVVAHEENEVIAAGRSRIELRGRSHAVASERADVLCYDEATADISGEATCSRVDEADRT